MVKKKGYFQMIRLNQEKVYTYNFYFFILDQLLEYKYPRCIVILIFYMKQPLYSCMQLIPMYGYFSSLIFLPIGTTNDDQK